MKVLSGEHLCRNCLHESVTTGVCPHELKRLARAKKDTVDPNQMNLYEHIDAPEDRIYVGQPQEGDTGVTTLAEMFGVEFERDAHHDGLLDDEPPF